MNFQLKVFGSNNKTKFLSYLLSIVAVVCAVYFTSWLLAGLSILIITIQLIIQLSDKNRKDIYINFNKNSDAIDWIGEGVFDYRKTFDGFEIEETESGKLFNKCFDWVNYKVELGFKILKGCLGIIVRAENFSNYIMLQFRDYGIRPHLRINGQWIAFEAEDVNVNMKFENKLSLDKFYKTIISLEGNSIAIKILDDKGIIFDREWRIPNGQTIIIKNTDEKVPSISLPINIQKGTFGFRNTGNERAVVKNLIAVSN